MLRRAHEFFIHRHVITVSHRLVESQNLQAGSSVSSDRGARLTGLLCACACAARAASSSRPGRMQCKLANSTLDEFSARLSASLETTLAGEMDSFAWGLSTSACSKCAFAFRTPQAVAILAFVVRRIASRPGVDATFRQPALFRLAGARRFTPCTECLHLLAAAVQEMEAEISHAASVATHFADRRWSTLSGAPLEDKRHLGGDADNEESSSAVPHLGQELSPDPPATPASSRKRTCPRHRSHRRPGEAGDSRRQRSRLQAARLGWAWPLKQNKQGQGATSKGSAQRAVREAVLVACFDLPAWWRKGDFLERTSEMYKADMMDTSGAQSSVNLGAAAANVTETDEETIATKQAVRHRVAPEAKSWLLDYAAMQKRRFAWCVAQSWDKALLLAPDVFEPVGDRTPTEETPRREVVTLGTPPKCHQVH